jgi:4-hydroxy-3-methylbut-2-en-1-yl diphosphate synthase IspG/GcpE
MGSEKIEPIDCPLCGREYFKNIEALINHIDAHNNVDPEIKLSIVARQEEYLSSLFG